MRFLKWLDKRFEEYILSGLLVVISVVMMLQVIMRYVFNASLSWAEEASRYAFVWSALISIGYTIKEDSILKVTTLLEALPEKPGRIVAAAVNGLVTVFFGYLFYHSIPAVTRVIKTGQVSPALGIPLGTRVIKTGQVSPALGIPLGLIYFAAAAGFFLAMARGIQKTGRDIRALAGRKEA